MTSQTRGGKSRRLSADERTLWTTVTRHVWPLRNTTSATAADATETPRAEAGAVAIARAARRPDLPPKPKPALVPFDRRLMQRVARGKDAIDGRLDLHGLTQAEAHAALRNFLHTAQNRGAKLVIVITGKGNRASGGESGVLKRQVPQWLRLPEFRSFVVGFEQAHRSHGGEGALYVRVRRAAR